MTELDCFISSMLS